MANELNFAFTTGLTLEAAIYADGWVQQGANIALTETGAGTGLYVGSVPGAPAIADGVYQVLFLDTIGPPVDKVIGRGPLYWAAGAEDRQAVQSVTAYANGIWIDTLGGGSPGQVPGVNGLEANPVNNITDALALAAALGCRSFKLLGPITLNAAFPFGIWEATGGATTLNPGGFDVGGSIFTRVGLTGAVNNASGAIFGFEAFLVGPITGLQGVFHDATISGTITAGAGILTLVDGVSSVPGVATPAIDLDGVASLNLRGYSGGIDLQGSSAPGQNSSIEITQGQVILDASNTAGVIAVRGWPDIIDNSAGATINLAAYGPNLVDEELTTQHGPGIWNNLTLQEFIEGGRDIDFVGNDLLGWQRIERDTAGVELARYNLFDDSGSRIDEAVPTFLARAGMISAEVKI